MIPKQSESTQIRTPIFSSHRKSHAILRPSDSNEIRVRRIHPAAGRLIMLSHCSYLSPSQPKGCVLCVYCLSRSAPENITAAPRDGSGFTMRLPCLMRLQCGGIRWRRCNFQTGALIAPRRPSMNWFHMQMRSAALTKAGLNRCASFQPDGHQPSREETQNAHPDWAEWGKLPTIGANQQSMP